MRRSELSDDVWTIPGQRTKNKRTHVVPLPPLARDLIPSNVFGSDLVFTNGKVAINGWSKTKHRIDQRMGIPPWRLHDLRRTAVTHMAELGIAPHVIELIVNHVSGFRSGVAGIYNKAELMPQRRAALEKWSLHISKISSEKIYLGIPTIATTHSDGSRPPVPNDRDQQCGAGADGAVG